MKKLLIISVIFFTVILGYQALAVMDIEVAPGELSAEALESDIEAKDELQLANQELKPVEVYFFKSSGCPHCASLEQYLDELQKEYSELTVKKFDFRKDSQSIILGQKLAKSYGGNIKAVPITFIGDQMIVGDDQPAVRDNIENCLQTGCSSPIAKIDASDFSNDTKVNKNLAGNVNKNLAGWIVLGVLLVVVLGFIIFFIIKK